MVGWMAGWFSSAGFKPRVLQMLSQFYSYFYIPGPENYFLPVILSHTQKTTVHTQIKDGKKIYN